MNTLTFFAQAPGELSEYIPNLEQAYIILVIAIPVMIAFLLLIAFMLLVSTMGVSTRLDAILRMLSDVFSEKLNELESAKSEQEKQAQLAREAAVAELRKAVKPMSRGHRIAVAILAISIPVLLLVLLLVTITF